MSSKLVPLLVLLVGLAAGGGSALLLNPVPGPEADAEAGDPQKPQKETSKTEELVEFVKLNNQFVIPVMENDRIISLVVISLSIEATTGLSEAVFSREPKLRDGFLQVMFDHANMGGFNGAFTRAENLEVLRSGLRDIAQRELGDQVRNVLITDIARQDA